MKKNTIIALTWLVFWSTLSVTKTEARTHTDPVDYVNILMGTQSEFELSNGNTYPAIAVPWGMNFWTPQTRKIGDGTALLGEARITGTYTRRSIN